MKINKVLVIVLFYIISFNLIMSFTLISSAYEDINNIQIKYRTHVQNIGWQNYVQNGEKAGTEGKSYRLEAININIVNKLDKNINIKYQVHIQDIGWQNWKTNGEMAGTEGLSKRLEAIRINLENTDDYTVMYRVHVQDIGWQDWKSNGELAGTEGQAKRLEAIEIKIVNKIKKAKMYIDTPSKGENFYKYENENEDIEIKGWKMANVSDTDIKAYIDGKEIDANRITYYKRQDVIDSIKDYGTVEQNKLPEYKFNINKNDLTVGNHEIKIEVLYKEQILTSETRIITIDAIPHIKYSTHVQNIGWQEFVSDAEIAGTTSKGLQVEALKIQVVNVPNNVNIKYKAHVQDIGWQEWKSNGEIAGTVGKSKKIEAIQIQLEGLEGYIIEYRSHVQNIGWQSWASNGMDSGTEGQNLRMEAMQARLVKSENTVVPQLKYSTFDVVNNWTDYAKNDEILGNLTNKFETIKIVLENTTAGSIKYQVHSQNIGWMDYVKNGGQAGQPGSGNGIEAIKIELEGLEGYSIEYRAYINGQGWQAWVSSGEIAGTTGQNKQISGIQIKFNIKTKKEKRINIDTIKYPGYKEKIEALIKAHPNWNFEILYTGLKFENVVAGEAALHSRNLVPTSYSGEWVCPVCGTKLYDSGWYCASEKATAYYMDPRNFLDDVNVFQFQDLNAYLTGACTLDGIKTKVKGTYLEKYEQDIDAACKNQNVNSYYIIARLLQEQGTAGTKIGTGMDGGDGKTYYNPFNIGASGNGYDQIYANALASAKSRGWDSMQKAIEGGITFCKKNWLENYQNTLYQNKFDIDLRSGASLYTHQYMQNLMAAYSEARTLRSMYANTNTINSTFTFIIPVYENMAASYEMPKNNSESSIINVRVTANGGLNLRKAADTNSEVIKTIPEGEIVLSIQRGINTDWQKVVLKDGTVGFMSGKYLTQVSDITTCNYLARVKTADGTGCKIRSGPGLSLDMITALSDGTAVTVIDDSNYKNIDGYDWYRIVLSDGRQAFMPGKYLSR